jgi:hypothetical protein
MRRALLLPSALATAATLAAPAPARADGTPPAPPQSGREQANNQATWWVDTRPWACTRWARPLAEEIQLACDAGAGCTIAPDGRSATRRATLVCGSDEHWALEARDRNGRVLWTLSLDGSHEDRLRQAGVWVARSDMPDLPPLSAESSPTPPGLPPELGELPDSPTEPPPPVAPPVPPPPAASDKPAASGSPVQPGWFAFSASAYVGEMRVFELPSTATVVGDASAPGSVGGNAAMGGLHAAAIAHSTHIYGGLSVGYEHSLTNFDGSSASLWRPGAVLGWGAPYGDGWFGVSASAGIAFLSASQQVSVPAGESLVVSPTTKPGPNQYSEMPVFAELALHAKLPLVFGQQPFLSVSAASIAHNAEFSPGLLLGLDLGVVWND